MVNQKSGTKDFFHLFLFFHSMCDDCLKKNKKKQIKQKKKRIRIQKGAKKGSEKKMNM